MVRSQKTSPASQAGMSLVEVLVGLFVLTVIGLSVLTMTILAMHLNRLAEERTIATSLAAERLNRIMSVPARPSTEVAGYVLAGETLVTGPPVVLTSGYGQIPEQPDFRREVTFLYDTPYAGSLTVEARVFWRHGDGGEKEHTLITFVNGGLQ